MRKKKTWQWEIPYAWRLEWENQPEAGDIPLPGLITKGYQRVDSIDRNSRVDLRNTKDVPG